LNEDQQAFETLKKLIIHQVTLVFPEESKEYTITLEALDYAIRAVLLPWDDEVKAERPIAFVSKIVNPTQFRYLTMEKELMAMVYALEKFCHYVYSHKFKCVTDHHACLWLRGKRNPNSKLAH
jgi:hypothetical protein